MKVGIIVFSQTGNCHEVARELEGRLSTIGHSVNLERVTTVGKPEDARRDLKFEHAPAVGPYDVIVFGAPVQAFSLAYIMKRYLEQVGSLSGKRVHLFTSKRFPNRWTGGNAAIGKMSRICRSKGAQVGETGIIFWKGPHMERTKKEVVDRIVKAIV